MTEEKIKRKANLYASIMPWDEQEDDWESIAERAYIKGATECITDLEKENAELKSDNDARKFAMAMSEKVEKQLREENTELKDDNKVMADNYSKMEQKFYSNLTNAKEIIRDLLSCLYSVEYDYISDLEEAEQFLKDCEVEK